MAAPVSFKFLFAKVFTNLWKGPLQKILEQIGFMQLIINWPLIDLLFPANYKVMNDVMTQLAIYDILPSDELYPGFFSIPTELFPPINERFNQAGYETTNTLMLLGSIFILFLFILIKAIFYATQIIDRGCRNKYVTKVRNFMIDGLVWNAPLDFIITGYFPIAFAVMISLEYMQWTTTALVLQNLCNLLFGVGLIALPVWQTWFLCKNFDQLGDLHNEKFLPAFKEM